MSHNNEYAKRKSRNKRMTGDQIPFKKEEKQRDMVNGLITRAGGLV